MLTGIKFHRRGKLFHRHPKPEPDPLAEAIKEANAREGYLAIFRNSVKVLRQ